VSYPYEDLTYRRAVIPLPQFLTQGRAVLKTLYTSVFYRPKASLLEVAAVPEVVFNYSQRGAVYLPQSESLAVITSQNIVYSAGTLQVAATTSRATKLTVYVERGGVSVAPPKTSQSGLNHTLFFDVAQIGNPQTVDVFFEVSNG
jgi:hypothetical protein